MQYVAARTASVARNAAEVGAGPGDADAFRPELLDHEKENELLKALAEFPAVVATAAELREPHRVARYLEETGAAPTTGSTTTAGCCRGATRRSPTCTGPGSGSTTPPVR